MKNKKETREERNYKKKKTKVNKHNIKINNDIGKITIRKQSKMNNFNLLTGHMMGIKG